MVPLCLGLPQPSAIAYIKKSVNINNSNIINHNKTMLLVLCNKCYALTMQFRHCIAYFNIPGNGKLSMNLLKQS